MTYSADDINNHNYKVVDSSGNEIKRVFLVNTDEGYLIRYPDIKAKTRPTDLGLIGVDTQLIYGNFKVV